MVTDSQVSAFTLLLLTIVMVAIVITMNMESVRLIVVSFLVGYMTAEIFRRGWPENRKDA